MYESMKIETTDKDVRSNNGQEHADGSYPRESEVSRLQETVERLTEKSTKGIGQVVATSTTRGGKRKGPRGRNGGDYGTMVSSSS